MSEAEAISHVHSKQNQNLTIRKWTIPTDRALTVGGPGSSTDIELPALIGPQLSLRWTGRAVEIRALNADQRPVVDGTPVLLARVRVNSEFVIGPYTFTVSNTAEVMLRGRPDPVPKIAQPATPTSGNAAATFQVPSTRLAHIVIDPLGSVLRFSDSAADHSVATITWTGKSMEIRATTPEIRPFIDGVAVLHARRRPGDEFELAGNLFRILSPTAVELVRASRAGSHNAVVHPLGRRTTAPGQRRWILPTGGSLTVGREGGPADIALSGLELGQRHAMLTWTGRAVEIRSLTAAARPFVDGRPILHARVPVGGRFMIGSHTLIVTAPAEVAVESVPKVAPCTSGSALLRFANVSLQYKNSTRPTLRNLSFALDRGAVLAVIGPSGAGKSTMCGGLLGEVGLTTGSMMLEHANLACARGQASHLVSFVPQQPAVFSNLSVRECLEWVARLRLAPDSTPEERAARVHSVISAMALDQDADKQVSDLSGGQKKRVSTAMELLSDPMLLVLDEPTSGLDEGLDRKMMDSLHTTARDDGRAVIVITHSMVNLDRADQVLALTGRGRMAYFGPPDALLPAFGAGNYAEVMDQLREDTITALVPDTVPEPATGGVPAVNSSRGSLIRHLRPLIGREFARQRNSMRQLGTVLGSGIALTALLTAAASGTGLAGGVLGVSFTLIALIVCLTFFSMAQSFASVVDDRSVIEREARWSISAASVIISRAIACTPMAWALGLGSTILYLILMSDGPPDPVLPHPLGLVIFSTLLPLAAMATGLLISTVSDSLRQAVFILMGVLALQVVLTGLAPIFSGTRGSIMSAIAVFTPARWASAGLGADSGILESRPVNDGLVQPSPFDDEIWTHDALHVYTGALALIVITLAALAGATAVLRRQLMTTK